MTKNLTFIAGPCVIEGEGEINLQVAKHLKQVAQNLGIKIYFKSSYDKANRTSNANYRGPGISKGLQILQRIKDETGLELLTDIHTAEEAAIVAQTVDFLQIPAFLCRQTDLLIAAGETQKPINIKKGQFLAPQDVKYCADKVFSTGNKQVFITERGTTFGYGNLVVDMRSIPIVQGLGLPMILDATHSVQLPGAGDGKSSGKREFAPVLAKAAMAAGCNGLFFETHPNPDAAPSDGPNMIPLEWVEPMLEQCLAINAIVNNTQKTPVLA